MISEQETVLSNLFCRLYAKRGGQKNLVLGKTCCTRVTGGAPFPPSVPRTGAGTVNDPGPVHAADGGPAPAADGGSALAAAPAPSTPDAGTT